MGLHRRNAQAYPEILLGSPAPLDGALFPQRPKLVCFKEVIFRSCCLAGGKTFFLNRRADCNRIPLFPECLLPFSTIFIPFFCVTQFPLSLPPSYPCLLFPSFTFSITAPVVQGSNTVKFAERDPASALSIMF